MSLVDTLVTSKETQLTYPDIMTETQLEYSLEVPLDVHLDVPIEVLSEKFQNLDGMYDLHDKFEIPAGESIIIEYIFYPPYGRFAGRAVAEFDFIDEKDIPLFRKFRRKIDSEKRMLEEKYPGPEKYFLNRNNDKSNDYIEHRKSLKHKSWERKCNKWKHLRDIEYKRIIDPLIIQAYRNVRRSEYFFVADVDDSRIRVGAIYDKDTLPRNIDYRSKK